MARNSAPTLWDDPSEPTWSVAEIGEALGAALRRAFPDEVWIRGEIRNLSRSKTGMVWFDLVEPATGRDRQQVVAKLPVVLFDAARRRVNARLQQAGGGVRMSDGTEVRIRGRLGWYGGGGRLQVQMSDVDPSFTLGRLAADRERLLRLLDAEGLLARQQTLARPVVPLRVGLVTSAGSAAEHDVLDELRASGLGFRVVRADVRVQGPSAPRSVARGLAAMARRGVDVVLLVRGGGAATDLAAFDSEVIARAVASVDVPVFTGIGHDIDRSVADEVAHAAYKTPTACAQAVIEDVRAYQHRLVACWQDVAGAATRRLHREAERLRGCGRHAAVATRHGLAAADRSLSTTTDRLRRDTFGALARSGAGLDRAAGRIESGARAHLRAHDWGLGAARGRLVQRAPRAVVAAGRELDRIDGQVRALDPARTLARGWSITRGPTGAIIRSPGEVATGDELRTTVSGGDIRSTVSATVTHRPAGGHADAVPGAHEHDDEGKDPE